MQDRKMRKFKTKKPISSMVYEDSLVVLNVPNSKVGGKRKESLTKDQIYNKKGRTNGLSLVNISVEVAEQPHREQ